MTPQKKSDASLQTKNNSESKIISQHFSLANIIQYYTLNSSPGKLQDADSVLHTYLKQAYRKEDLTQQSLSHEKWYEPDVVKLCTALNSTLLELLTAVCSPRNSVHEQVNEFEVEEGEELGEEERERQGMLKEGIARIVELNV